MEAVATSKSNATSGTTLPPDHTGRSRLVFNVVVTWFGQMAYFVSGFIMPRLIDRKLGQEVLGVWDFSWSLVTYFRIVDMGIVSSVNRYVGKYWSRQDVGGINSVLNSATLALFCTAILMFLITVAVVLTLPYWFADRLGEYAAVAQKSVFCLGAMLSFGTALGGFNGVLTGCHRWELQTLRNTGWYVASVIGMIIALHFGAGLVTLAIITAVCNILAHLTLVLLAYRVCPGLELRRSHVRVSTIKELYHYGAKTLMPIISELLMNQTTSVLVIAGLGPASLAVFSRPRSMLRQVDTLQRKMAMILVPTTSSLQATGQHDQIEKLMVKSVRYSVYLVLPLVITLVTFGGELMKFWMGPNYGDWTLPAILAIGFLGNCIQMPIYSLLSGLNGHGRAGIAQLFGSALSVVSVFVALKVFHSGLAGVAIAVTLPLLLVNVIYLPVLLCRRLGQSLGRFYSHVAVRPIVHIIPFAAVVIGGRILFKTSPLLAMALCGCGGIWLLNSYWRHVLPEKLKSPVRRLAARVSAAAR